MFNSRKINIVLLLLAIGVIVFLAIRINNSIKSISANGKIDNTIDTIMLDNKIMLDKIHELEQKQVKYVDLIEKNNYLIRQNNNELVKLKKAYNEKINNVNNYNVSQLDSFFTNRYKTYYNR